MRTDAKAFDAILAGRSPEIAEVARAARALVLDVLPEAFEVVWAQQKNAGYGTGPKKQTEHFCWISPASAHVTFGFNHGAELDDPKQLLEGTGKKFRHVKLASRADVEQAALRALVRIATTHRVPPAKPL
ncbi:MAG TPA: DUF1801 domain-containing protein [Kofleriaceae bacterium]|jgi:hypothetical protein